MTSPTDATGARLVVARGPRALERHVLAWVDAHAPRDLEQLATLAGDVRLLVPSGALRDHLAARLCAAGRARLGVRVQTLDALAHEVLARAGASVRRADLLLETLVRRAATEEPALQALLGELDDGFAPLVAVVRDLFDAGLDADVVPVLAEAVDALPTTRRRIERLHAILRVHARVRAFADERGLALPGDRYHAAAALLEEDAPAVLPAHALLAVGFADVTGRAGELLEALCRHAEAAVAIERPLDPAPAVDRADVREDLGARFSDRLLERLEPLLGPRVTVEPEAPARRTLARAPSREAEVRAVAERVRGLLDGGVAPERIALVARDATPFRVALATHLTRLGIPFATGRVQGLADGATARLAALLALLERGDETRLDHWLDALEQGAEAHGGPLTSPELRLGLRVLGLARLEDVHALDLDAILGTRRALPLPLRRGATTQDESEPTWPGADPAEPDGADEEQDEGLAGEPDPAAGSGGLRGRRYVPAERLRQARARALATRDRLGAWPARADAAAHAAALDALVLDELGWTQGDPATRRLARARAEVLDHAHDVELSREEFVRLLRRALEPLLRTGLGRGGGGVRVLEVMEARGRAFEHLFVLGVERGLFPRAGGEDPLLPDGLRASLTSVLPALPVKRRRRDEERFLFAGLCDAAEHVHVGHATADDDGAELLPSPLFLRLAGEGASIEALPTPLPARFEDAFGGVPRPRTAVELATQVALVGARFDAAARGRVRAAAVVEAGVPTEYVAAVARHHRAVLDAYEGRGDAAARPGPWTGLLGEGGAGRAWPDPLATVQPITAFERYAACGWQLFLERVLGLEPLPDPMAALPTIDARQLGNAVHRALEAVALGDFPGAEADPPPALADVLARPGTAPAWPASEAALYDLAHQAAELELRESGVPLPGLVRGLALRALPYLRAARARLDAGAPRRVLGAEATGALRVELEDEGVLELRFRVDRVDRVEAGEDAPAALELVDYKTGRPWIVAKKPTTRAEKTLAHVAAGSHLQALAYARAAAEAAPDDPVAGRYVFLKDGVEPHAETLDVRTDAEGYDELVDALDLALGRCATAWRRGVFLPRLLKPGDPDRAQANPVCGWCRVSEACVRGDSAAARRLAAWEAADGHDEVGVLRIARSAWLMGHEDV